MSALTFLATALTTMLIVSAIVCLAIYGPEEEKNFIQGTFEVFWLIAGLPKSSDCPMSRS